MYTCRRVNINLGTRMRLKKACSCVYVQRVYGRTAGLPRLSSTAINLCPQDLIVVRRVAIQVHGHKLCGRAGVFIRKC